LLAKAAAADYIDIGLGFAEGARHRAAGRRSVTSGLHDRSSACLADSRDPHLHVRWPRTGQSGTIPALPDPSTVHGVAFAIQVDLMTDNLRVSAEAPLPQLITQDGNVTGAPV